MSKVQQSRLRTSKPALQLEIIVVGHGCFAEYSSDMKIYESVDEFTGVISFVTDKTVLHKKTFRFGIPEFTHIGYSAQTKVDDPYVILLSSRQSDYPQWQEVEKFEFVSGESRFSLETLYEVELVFEIEAGVLETLVAEVDQSILETLASETSKIRVGPNIFELSSDFNQISQLMLDRMYG